MVVVVGLTQAAAQLHRRTEYAQYIIYRKHLVCASSLDQSNAVAVCGGAQLHDYYTNDWQGHSRNIYNKQMIRTRFVQVLLRSLSWWILQNRARKIYSTSLSCSVLIPYILRTAIIIRTKWSTIWLLHIYSDNVCLSRPSHRLWSLTQRCFLNELIESHVSFQSTRVGVVLHCSYVFWHLNQESHSKRKIGWLIQKLTTKCPKSDRNRKIFLKR